MKNSNPLASVIVPCYNYANFISDTLDSLIDQTYDKWECIIVDDGSTDNSKEIISEYLNKDKRFTYIYQQNSGLSEARNTGIIKAAGDFFQFLDADDKIERKKLEIQANILINNPDIDIVYGDVRYFTTENPDELFYSMWSTNKPWMPKISGKGHTLLTELIKANIMVVSSPLIKRKAIELCGLFDKILKGSEDWDFWVRCALLDLIFVYHDVPDTCTLVRSHPKSMSKNKLFMLLSSLEVHRKWLNLIKNEEFHRATKLEINNINKEIALEKIRRNNRLQGMTELIKLSSLTFNAKHMLDGIKLMLQ